MMKQQVSATDTQQPEVVITRDFNAPREEVWKALTDPNWLKQWWGPRNFTAPVIQNDLRVGGKYLYCMRSPDGKEYWSTGNFRKIDVPKRLVYTDSFSDEKGNVVSPTYNGFRPDFPIETLVDITLEDQKGKTRLTLKWYNPPFEKDRSDAIVGWNESLDKMAEFLETH
jgi:uncharacterized protein YndB with AHSA1/START domain